MHQEITDIQAPILEENQTNTDVHGAFNKFPDFFGIGI